MVLAELVAHAIVGFEVTTIEPGAPISGREFQKARIGGVVEDFFDWPISAVGGDDWIRTLAHRIASFDWSGGVQHDILKVLYESIITPTQRHALGEYSTPDRLAERIVGDAVDAPLGQRVHDPSCGSGTFVVHAARRSGDPLPDLSLATNPRAWGCAEQRSPLRGADPDSSSAPHSLPALAALGATGARRWRGAAHPQPEWGTPRFAGRRQAV